MHKFDLSTRMVLANREMRDIIIIIITAIIFIENQTTQPSALCTSYQMSPCDWPRRYYYLLWKVM